MDINKLAGGCLIILGIVNVLHEFVVRSTGRGEPGFGYAVVTALFFTFGVMLLLRKSVDQNKRSLKTKGPSIVKN
jgi:hypothetical protein